MIRKLVSESLDLVTGARSETSPNAYRRGHRFGNWMLTTLVASLFGNRFSDMLSGYRVLSRRFVKSFPGLSVGFEIETELAVHALQVRLPIAEIQTPYRNRPIGSNSKLKTVSDGVRIFSTIVQLLEAERPLYFFGVLGALFLLASLVTAYPVVMEYLHTGLVPRLPTAVLATGLALIACLNLVCGLILETVTKGRLEMKRMHYLSIPIRLRAGVHRDGP
jgi:hypothetical protein